MLKIVGKMIAPAASVIAALLVFAACGGADPTATRVPPAPTATQVPTQVAPTQAAPTQAAPTQAAPTQAAPTQAAPTQVAPTQAAPTQVPPTQVPPTQAAPTQVPPTPTPAPTARPVVQAKLGGTLQARTGRIFGSYDTYSPFGSFAFPWSSNWLNSLITLDLDDASAIRPDLAREWEVSQDGTVYTFHLVRGVQWHDGQPFTSADALYNLTTGWQPGETGRTSRTLAFARVAEIEAPDDFTVRITLDRASASFLPGLAHPGMLVYPAHFQDMDEWDKTRIGTGPFEFESVDAASAIKSLRNDQYWKKDEAGGPLPYLDGVVHHVLTADFALAAFRAGRLDCGCNFDTDFQTVNRDTLKRLFPDWQEFTFWAIAYLYLNQKEPLVDARARQAISAGLNRRKFAEVNERGFNYFPSTFLYQPELGGQWGLTEPEILKLPGYREDRAADLAEAGRLFSEAGVDPSQVSVGFISSSFYADSGPTVDEDLREMGFQSELLIPSRADSIAMKRRGDFHLTLETPAPAFDEPAEYFGRYVITGASSNFGKWSNPKVDQLFLDIDTTLDPKQRRALALELQQELIDWAILIPLSYIGRAQGPRGYVKGYNHADFLSIDLGGRVERVWLDN